MKTKKLLQNALQYMQSADMGGVIIKGEEPGYTVNAVLTQLRCKPKLGQKVCIEWDGESYVLITGIFKNNKGKITSIDLQRLQSYNNVAAYVGTTAQDFLTVTLKQYKTLFCYKLNKNSAKK